MTTDDRDRGTGPDDAPEPVEDRISSRIGERTARPGDQDPAGPGAMSPLDVQEDTMTIPTTSAESHEPGDPGPARTTPLPVAPEAGERTAATSSAAAPTAPAAQVGAKAPARRSVRMGTIVWGLVIAAVGVFTMAYALDVPFDEELAFIGLLGVAGVLLLVGSLVTSRRRK